ncbi:uncharacterized protein EI90DRAFT_3029417 [Cantharellus anzutake]|uniref:uncharacterized protein n=1 Tax=Cantharellus anzutake TaxID=1750568 RepID=UPI00190813B9|nr:uncharacterized protein EI90DRAFT_3029417 [Cantharellus anzutake]KAF8342560.1 hypothetical protein EI90DRAFT_3029417 [Cantharellus anzutake]
MASDVLTASPRRSSSPLQHLGPSLSLRAPSTVSPKSSRKSFISVSDNPRSSIVSTSAASYATAILDGAPSASMSENTASALHIFTKATPPGQTVVVTSDSSVDKETSGAGIAAPATTNVPNGKEIPDDRPKNIHTRTATILPNGYLAPPSPPSSESLNEEHGPVLGLQLTEEPPSTGDAIAAVEGTSQVREVTQPPPVSYPGRPRVAMGMRSHTAADFRRQDDQMSLDSSYSANGYAIQNQDKTSVNASSPRTNNGSTYTITASPSSSPEKGTNQDYGRASMSSVATQRPVHNSSLSVVDPSNLLHPLSAVASPMRALRRNTTDSSFRPRHRKARSLNLDFMKGADATGAGDLSTQSTSAFTPAILDPDILREAEQIRRERTSKRTKAQDGGVSVAHPSTMGVATAATAFPHTAPPPKGRDEEDHKPLVGNLIGEDHANYILMYNMLTGIRIGIRRPLTPKDYTARHKYTFDIIGNELTPSAKYDFKFKDYASWVFRELREDYFHLDPADYLLSLTSKYILSELGSPGKSGSFFYFSRDYRFIIKTIHHNEHKFLRKILPLYYEHVRTNPHTLLSRFYGLHRVKLPHGRKIHFVIMNNLFPPHRDIHETYDLKGSTVGREYPEEKALNNSRAVLKDLNWINRGRQLELGPEKCALLTEQLRRDSEFLKRLNVMDYSLLVGIHNMQRGNRDNLRRNTLRVFQPDVYQHLVRRRRASQSGKDTATDASVVRRVMRRSDLQAIGTTDSSLLPEVDSTDRRHFIFYQDEGGFRATDEANRQMDTIYYLGIIDILTPYTTFKKLEHAWKGLHADRHKISPVPAEEYGSRFFAFLKSVMRGGGGAQSFK